MAGLGSENLSSLVYVEAFSCKLFVSDLFDISSLSCFNLFFWTMLRYLYDYMPTVIILSIL